MSALLAFIALVISIAVYRRYSGLEDRIAELRRETDALRDRLRKTEAIAGSAPPPREQIRAAVQPSAAPPGRTKCDACGTVYPSHHYLQAAGSRGYVCSDCAKSPAKPAAAPKPETSIPAAAAPAEPTPSISVGAAAPRGTAALTDALLPAVKKAEEARFAPAPLAASATADRIENWEARLGGSWLSRIGITLLVIGIAFALGYTIKVLGPAGKAVLATTTSLLLIAGGVLLERRKTYRFYGRGLIAGGWAALYSTAYAVHELEATRIVESPVVGFVLLLLVGTGMIVHSLRYGNQGLTALSYGLAYAAIVLHSISAYTLAAAALLGAGTMLHLLRRRWYGVALGGIAATYGSLLLWYLRQREMTGQGFQFGLGALAIDWVVFAAADFAPEPVEKRDRRSVWAVGLLNGLCAGSLSFLAWHRIAPDGGWQPLAGLGVLYVLTSATLRRMGRCTAHRVHSMAAVILLAFAAWKGLDRIPCTWFWLAEAQVVVLLGVRLKDRFHRLLGSALFLAPMIAIVYEQIGTRLGHPDGVFDLRMFLLTVLACGCFYLTFGRLKPFVEATERTEEGTEEAIRRSFSYAAFVLILLAFWVQLPGVYVAPAAALLMLLLFELAAVRADRDLRIQSYLAGACVALSALGLSVPSPARLGGVSARVPALLVCAASYFFVFLRQRRGRSAFPDLDLPLRPAFSWAAFVLILLASWLQLPRVYVAPAAVVLMLLSFELAAALEERHLRIQSYFAAAYVALTALGLSAPSPELLGGVRARVPVLLVCAASYFFVFLRQRRGRSAFPDIDLPLRAAFSWAGTVLVGLLVWFEARPIAVGPAWMLLALFLVEIGIALGEPHLRRPGYLVLVSAQVSLAMSNLTITDKVLGVSARAATLVPSIVAGYYLWWRLRSLGSADGGPPPGATASGAAADATDERYGRVLSYLNAGLVALFFRFEFGLDGAALRWSVAMIALLVAGHLLRDADFRLQGYALAGVVFVRAVGFDFARASPILALDGARVIAVVGVISYGAAGFLLRRRAVLRAAAGAASPPERRLLSLESRIESRGQDLMWLLAVALAAVYFFRTTSGFVLIVAWAIEGLCATAGGFALKTRSLRLAGLGLLGLGLSMTLVRAFTTFDTLGRIVSFLVLGIVLLLVSFGYARYRASSGKSEGGGRPTGRTGRT